jgi:hypothetical protein
MNLPQPPDRWDIEQITTDRVHAIEAFGFTERQARFLVTVMLHAGVFVERQYCAFANIVHGQKTHDFVRKLIDGKFASAIVIGRLHRGRLIHVQHKRLYAAIGQVDNRHRKRAELGRLIERVMVLDAVLADRSVVWLGTEHDKVSCFQRRVGDRLNIAEFPRLVFGNGPTKTVRYFPDKLPIGIRLREDPVVFIYLVTRPAPFDFRLFLCRYGELLRALPEWTIRLFAPTSLRNAMPMYLHAVREECASPLTPAVVEELQWYFRLRRDLEATAAARSDMRFRRATARFRAPRFRALHRAWEQQGDTVLWATQSHVLRDKLARGVAQVEAVELAHQYLHLSGLVGKA